MTMFMITLTTVLLVLPYVCHCSTLQDSDTIYQDFDTLYKNSLTALNSPTLCHLKLICTISQSGDSQLKNSNFMQGISMLSGYRGNHPLTPGLELAIRTGTGGKSCSSVTPDCHHSDRELLIALQDMGLTDTAEQSRVRRQTFRRGHQEQDLERRRHQAQDPERRRRPLAEDPYNYSPNRRQGLMSRIPPIFRPDNAGRLQVCKDCDQRGTICTVYGIGTFIGCNGVALAAGPGGPAACNAATTPGSIGCGMNTLYCLDMFDLGISYLFCFLSVSVSPNF